jgi:transcriptional regulator with XRE-family HTH domain
MIVLPDDKKRLLLGFGSRLEALIYQRFRSKDQFLAASGFYKANLHGIITGKSDPQLSTLYRLAKALDLTLDELLQGLTPGPESNPSAEGAEAGPATFTAATAPVNAS